MNIPRLMIVLPVYNEREAIRHVIDSWMAALSGHLTNFLILAIDDGSKDDSASILSELRQKYGERLEVRIRENRGHGQTCMEGYRIAAERGVPYVLQIDSDGQSDPCFFGAFWEKREEHDVIYGNRRRLDGLPRMLASFVLRTLLRIFESVDCVDPNVPYRLMNTISCRDAILSIPSSVGLANVALAVRLKKDTAMRHGMVAIDFPPRHGGEPSVPMSKFLIKGVELFAQLREMREQQAP